MAGVPDRERVKAQVDALCRSFLRFSLALAWGWKGLAALSLIGSPIAYYLSGEAGPALTPAIHSPFWSALSSGLGATVLVALFGYMLSERLGSWTTSRAANRFNRLYPIGRERDLGLSLLQQRQREAAGAKAASLGRLVTELGADVLLDVEGAPVEAQLAEALETLAAGREEGSPAAPAEPVAPSHRSGDGSRRRLRAGSVIPLQPEGVDVRRSRPTGRRPGKKAREGPAT